MVGQAQVDDDRMYELALRHFQAFFFLHHLQPPRKPWLVVERGTMRQSRRFQRTIGENDIALAFMEKTRNWLPRMLANGVAEGHFRLAIRKHPEQDIWSLGRRVERQLSALSPRAERELPCGNFSKSLPKLKLNTFSQSSNRIIRAGPSRDLRKKATPCSRAIGNSQVSG